MSHYHGIKFTDADIVNPDDWIPDGEFNPHRVRGWLFHDHGFVLGIAFADCESDALDELADHGKLDHLKVGDDPDYATNDAQERLNYLGNHGEPYDIDTLSILELPSVSFSFCAQFDVAHKK